MNQRLTEKAKPYTKKRQCVFRTNNISWCKKLKKTCDSPNEYPLCASYQEPQIHQTPLPSEQNTENKTIYSNGNQLETKIGVCDICKTTKKTLLLKYGFTLCEDCLSICTIILEHLELEEKTNKKQVSRQTRQPAESKEA